MCPRTTVLGRCSPRMMRPLDVASLGDRSLGWCGTGTMRPLDDVSPRQCVPWTMRPLDDASLGRCVTWTMRPLDDASLERCVPWTMRPLNDATLRWWVTKTICHLDEAFFWRYFHGLGSFSTSAQWAAGDIIYMVWLYRSPISVGEGVGGYITCTGWLLPVFAASRVRGGGGDSTLWCQLMKLEGTVIYLGGM